MGIDLRYLIDAGLATLEKKIAPPPSSNPQTPFARLSLRFMMNHRLVNNYESKLLANNLSAQARGSINLINKELYYHIIGYDLEKSAMQIPIILSGQINHPHVQLDTQTMGGAFVKKDDQERVENVMDQLLNR